MSEKEIPKTIQFFFNKVKVVFLMWAGQWMVPANVLGRILGYSKNGSKLTDQIRGPWAKSFKTNEQAVFLTGKPLAKFKEMYGDHFLQIGEDKKSSVSEFTSQVLLLTVSGVLRVLMKSSSVKAEEFQSWFTEKMETLTKLNSYNIEEIASQKRLPPPVEEPSRSVSGKAMKPKDIVKMLDSTRIACDFLLFNEIASKEEIRKIMLAAIATTTVPSVIKDFALNGNEAAALTPADRTAVVPEGQTVPQGTVSVSPEIVPFGQRPFGLDDNWLSLHEIGASMSPPMDHTELKKYSESLREGIKNSSGKELLANVVARTQASEIGVANMQRFKDRHVFCSNEMGTCFAFYCESSGNQVHWRNYWSPIMVNLIKEAAEAGRNSVKATKKKTPPVAVFSEATEPAAAPSFTANGDAPQA